MITAVHPAARAAPSFRVIMAEGKFQGVRMDLENAQMLVLQDLKGEGLHDTWTMQMSGISGREEMISTDWLLDDDISRPWYR